MENYYLSDERSEKTASDFTKKFSEIETENKRLSIENEQLLNENKKISAENISFSDKIRQLSDKLLESESIVSEIRTKLSEATSRLKEQEEIERILTEYDRKLDGIIEMKKNYERRIADLEAYIRDLSGESSLATTPGFNPKPSTIDMTSEIASELPPTKETDTDWLLDLPSL